MTDDWAAFAFIVAFSYDTSIRTLLIALDNPRHVWESLLFWASSSQVPYTDLTMFDRWVQKMSYKHITGDALPLKSG